jgi:hypothetical protein
MRLTGSPHHANYPAERSKYQIHEGAKHENLHRAPPVAEPAENHAERAIAHAENNPANEARCQEVSWEAQEPKDGNARQEAQDRGGGNIALHREAIQERRVIGNQQPGGEYQRQAHTDVNTGADGRIAENVEPTITGQMRTYQHERRVSQDASIRSTRIYGDGCVTSTATGAHGGLSFPARSTAVTVYQ